MIKKILTYSFGEVLVKAVSFLAVPLYSHLILPAEYGILGFLNSLVSFLPFIFTFYYLYAFVRFAVEVKPVRLISTYFYLGMFLNLFYVCSALVIYELFVDSYHIEFKYFVLSIAASSVIYNFQILQMYYRSQGMAKSYIQLSVFYTLLGLLLNLIFLILFEDNVQAMLLSSFITSLSLSLYAFIQLRYFISWRMFSVDIVKRVLRYSVPLVPGAMALLLFSQSDKIILMRFVSRDEVGIYTVAFTLGLSMAYIGNAFFMSYQPIFYEKISQGYFAEISSQFWKNVLFILSALILSFLVIYTAYFFVDSKYRQGLSLALMIATAYCFIAFSHMMELHLTHLKKTSMVSLVYGIGGVATVGMLWFFIPRYGIHGAAWSLVAGGAMISVIMYNVAQKYLYMDYHKTVLIAFYIIIAGIIWGIL